MEEKLNKIKIKMIGFVRVLKTLRLWSSFISIVALVLNTKQPTTYGVRSRFFKQKND